MWMLFLEIFNASILSSVPMNNGVLITLKNSCGARRYEELNFFRISSRNSYPETFLGKGVLKICSKEHPCWSVILIKLLCNFIEITFRHGCSPVNLWHNFRIPFPKYTSGWLLLDVRLTKLGNLRKSISSIQAMRQKTLFDNSAK